MPKLAKDRQSFAGLVDNTQIPDTFCVEAGGTVIEIVPCQDKPGYYTTKNHTLLEFI